MAIEIEKSTNNSSETADPPKRRESLTVHHNVPKIAKKLSFWFTHKPFTVMLFVSFSIFAILGGVALGGYFEFTERNDSDFFIKGDHRVQLYDAILLAENEVDRSDDEDVQEIQIVPRKTWDLMFLFESKSDDLLKSDVIDQIKKTEECLTKDPEWPHFCLLHGGNCTGALSLTEMIPFFGGINVAIPMFALAQDTQMIQMVRLFFDKNFHVGNMKSKFIRAYYPFGLPLPKDENGQPYKSANDRFPEQLKLYNEFSERVDECVKRTGNTDEMNSYLFSERLITIAFQKVSDQDLVWSTGSVCFVFIYISFHTRSMFIGTLGILQVIMSFPLAWAFYRLILGISFFQALHTLAIFIILGIGADNIFVFVDAWNQAPALVPRAKDDMLLRMEYTYMRATKAMFVTSFTTMAAFLSTSISDIIPIGTFGLFAGSLVAFNYLLDIVFLPAVVVVWEIHFRHNPRLSSAVSRIIHPIKKALGSSQKEVEKPDPAPVVDFPGHKDEFEAKDILEDNELRWMERFFYTYWIDFVQKYRYIIILAFATLFGLSIAAATQLSPLSQQEEWFPESHYLGRMFKILGNEFKQSEQDTSVTVELVWGIKGVDTSKTSRFDPTNRGELIWDTNFKIYSPEAQEHLLDTCNKASVLPMSKDFTPSCFIKDFAQWLQNEKNISFPLTSSEAVEKALLEPGLSQNDAFSTIFSEFTSGAGASFIRTKEIGLGPGNSIAFVKLIFPTDLAMWEPYNMNKPYYDTWQSFIEQQNEIAPSGVNFAIQSAGPSWAWMQTERSFVTNAVQGMTMSISAAFVVLLLSTMNFYVAVFATFSIIGIVSSVIAIMVLSGWELGVTESISCVILIGFSVDYVVHLGNAYIESTHATRIEKARSSVTEMGISVVAGACTTFGAGLFLWPAVIIFFTKFAILITSTIGFSLLWSLFFFLVMLSSFGPEGNSGSLRACLKYCKSSKVVDANQKEVEK